MPPATGTPAWGAASGENMLDDLTPPTTSRNSNDTNMGGDQNGESAAIPDDFVRKLIATERLRAMYRRIVLKSMQWSFVHWKGAKETSLAARKAQFYAMWVGWRKKAKITMKIKAAKGKMDLIAGTLVMWKMVIGFGMWRGAVFFKTKWAWEELNVDSYKSENPPDRRGDYTQEHESIYSRFAYHSQGLDEAIEVPESPDGSQMGVDLSSKEMRRRRAMRAANHMKGIIRRVVNTKNSAAFTKWRAGMGMMMRAKAAMFHIYQRDLCTVWNNWRLDAWASARAKVMLKRAVRRMLYAKLSAAFFTWHQDSTSSMGEATKALVADRRFLNRMIACSWTVWRETCEESKKGQMALYKAIIKVMQVSLMEALNQWRSHTQGSLDSRDGLAKAAQKLLSSRVSDAYCTWCSGSKELRKRNRAVRKVLVRMMQRESAATYERWQDFALDGRSADRKMRKAVKKMIMSKSARVLSIWRYAMVHKMLMTHAMLRLLQRTIGQYILRWRHFGYDCLAEQTKVGQSLLRMMERGQKEAYVMWQAISRKGAGQRGAMRQAVLRLFQVKLNASLNHWKDVADEGKFERMNQIRSALFLMNRSVASAMYTWRVKMREMNLTNESMRRGILKMMHNQREQAWVQWKVFTGQTRAGEIGTGSALIQLSIGLLRWAWNEWRAKAGEAAEEDGATQGVLMKLNKIKLSGAMQAWYFIYKEAEAELEIMRNALLQVTKIQRSRAWRVWTEEAWNEKNSRNNSKTGTQRLMQRKVLNMYNHWVAQYQNKESSDMSTRQVLMRLIKHRISNGFHMWLDSAREMMRNSGCMRKAVISIQHRGLGAVMSDWRDLALRHIVCEERVSNSLKAIRSVSLNRRWNVWVKTSRDHEASIAKLQWAMKCIMNAQLKLGWIMLRDATTGDARTHLASVRAAKMFVNAQYKKSWNAWRDAVAEDIKAKLATRRSLMMMMTRNVARSMAFWWDDAQRSNIRIMTVMGAVHCINNKAVLGVWQQWRVLAGGVVTVQGMEGIRAVAMMRASLKCNFITWWKTSVEMNRAKRTMGGALGRAQKRGMVLMYYKWQEMAFQYALAKGTQKNAIQRFLVRGLCVAWNQLASGGKLWSNNKRCLKKGLDRIVFATQAQVWKTWLSQAQFMIVDHQAQKRSILWFLNESVSEALGLWWNQSLDITNKTRSMEIATRRVLLQGLTTAYGKLNLYAHGMKSATTACQKVADRFKNKQVQNALSLWWGLGQAFILERRSVTNVTKRIGTRDLGRALAEWWNKTIQIRDEIRAMNAGLKNHFRHATVKSWKTWYPYAMEAALMQRHGCRAAQAWFCNTLAAGMTLLRQDARKSREDKMRSMSVGHIRYTAHARVATLKSWNRETQDMKHQRAVLTKAVAKISHKVQAVGMTQWWNACHAQSREGEAMKKAMLNLISTCSKKGYSTLKDEMILQKKRTKTVNSIIAKLKQNNLSDFWVFWKMACGGFKDSLNTAKKAMLEMENVRTSKAIYTFRVNSTTGKNRVAIIERGQQLLKTRMKVASYKHWQGEIASIQRSNQAMFERKSKLAAIFFSGYWTYWRESHTDVTLDRLQVSRAIKHMYNRKMLQGVNHWIVEAQRLKDHTRLLSGFFTRSALRETSGAWMAWIGVICGAGEEEVKLEHAIIRMLFLKQAACLLLWRQQVAAHLQRLSKAGTSMAKILQQKFVGSVNYWWMVTNSAKLNNLRVWKIINTMQNSLVVSYYKIFQTSMSREKNHATIVKDALQQVVRKRAVMLYRGWRLIAVLNTGRNMKVKATLMKAMHKLSIRSYNSWKGRTAEVAARGRKAKGIGKVLLERDVKKCLSTWKNAVYEKRVVDMKTKRVLKQAFSLKSVKALVTWWDIAQVKVARNAKVESCLSRWKMRRFATSIGEWQGVAERRSATKDKIKEVAASMSDNLQLKVFHTFLLIARDDAKSKAAMSKVLKTIEGAALGKALSTWTELSKDIIERKERARNALVMMQEGDKYIAWGSLIGYATVQKNRRAISAKEKTINNDRMLRQSLMNMKMSFMYYKISSGNYKF